MMWSVDGVNQIAQTYIACVKEVLNQVIRLVENPGAASNDCACTAGSAISGGNA